MKVTPNIINLKYCGKDFMIEIYPQGTIRIIGAYDLDVLKYYHLRVRNYLEAEGFLSESASGIIEGFTE